MKLWEQLTEAGQMRRLRPLALAALRSFPIAPTRLRLVGGFTNVIFRVDTDRGPYALRVDLHQDHSDEDVITELAWLAAIAAETDLDVCRFVPADDGAPFVYATGRGVPGSRRCVLFEWIRGRPLAERLSELGYHRLGRLAAGLHRHGRTFTPPHRPLTWDRIFYWPEEVDPVVINEPRMDRFIGPERRLILERAIELIEPAFARLDPAAAQVVHGDLHPWNVHTYRGRLVAFDFEDVTWGHPVQDVAITLYYERHHPAYPKLRKAFSEGYQSIAPWPATSEGELERFMAARSVMFVNYVANLRDDPSEYYDTVFPRLETFVTTWAET